MKTASVNFNTYQTSFKSAYPVVHWVAETNGSYAPVANLQITKKLQGKIIRILNKPLSSSNKPMLPTEQHLRAYIGSCDAGYRTNPLVRSFYNYVESNPQRFTPVSYIISGNDVEVFNNSIAKNIGETKGRSRDLRGSVYSLETEAALRHYHHGGLCFVKAPSRQIADEKGIKYILHTKFEIVRNKFGKIKDYRFIDARFLPASGPKNPIAGL